MRKTVFHGSERVIKKPVFGFGKPYNDYGLGFYCTEDPDLAKEWSVDENRFVLKSRKAFSRIEFKEATLAKASDWFALKKGRDDEARRIYRGMRAKRERNGLYITKIMDEEMTADDLRV